MPTPADATVPDAAAAHVVRGLARRCSALARVTLFAAAVLACGLWAWGYRELPDDPAGGSRRLRAGGGGVRVLRWRGDRGGGKCSEWSAATAWGRFGVGRVVTRYASGPPDRGPAGWSWAALEPADAVGLSQMRGLAGWGPCRYQSSRRASADGTASSTFGVSFPCWVAVAALAAWPVGAAALGLRRRARARRRRRSGRCVRCGYDLRASPSDCPECGPPRASARVGPRDPRAG
jgi:hypothetical protein